MKRMSKDDIKRAQTWYWGLSPQMRLKIKYWLKKQEIPKHITSLEWARRHYKSKYAQREEQGQLRLF